MSAGNLYSYSADQVDVIFAGVSLSEGLADGDFCKITYPNEAWITKQGTDGTVVRSKRIGLMAEIEITVQQGSIVNNVLSAIFTADYVTANGSGIAPVLVADRNGTSLHAGAKAWIKGPPEVTYSREMSEVSWTLSVADLKSFVGGR